jgi:peptide deformylase
MILSIVAYGHSILREKCVNIDRYYPLLENLIDSMWETMDNANGCGLAAPQVGHGIKLFVVDSQSTYENLDEPNRQQYFDKNDTGLVETFINAQIIDHSERVWLDKEGCLSIPGTSQEVWRPWAITLKYHDQNFTEHTRTFRGATARMIQHEYDHTEGVLYIDYLDPFIRKLTASKLRKIVRGQVRTKYPMG